MPARSEPPPAQGELIERLRDHLAAETTREVAMFGTRAFMVDEKLAVCARKDGGLLVRVAAERHDELTARPGAAQAEMGQGRSMGPGWLTVTPEAVSTEKDLAGWVGIALEHNRTA